MCLYCVLRFVREFRCIGSVLVADVRQADRARSGHVVLEADIFVDKEEDTITWL